MSYAIPDNEENSPSWHAKRLIHGLPEFHHLQQVSIRFLMRSEPLVEAGRYVLGTMHLPTVQGRLKGVFSWLMQENFGAVPDYLMVLDTGYWEASDQRLREILIYHELCHAVQKLDREGEPRFDEDGLPIWGLVGHDVEEFSAVVARYGAHSSELKFFLEAAAAGEGRA